MNMDRKTELKRTALQLAIFLSLSQVTCQHCKKKKTVKQQTSKVFRSTKSNQYSTLWRTTYPFIPLLSFSFILQRLVSETFHFKRKKKQLFIAPDRSEMISLQNIPLVVTVSVRDRKILPIPNSVRLKDFRDTDRSQTEKKKMRKVTYYLRFHKVHRTD